MMRPYLLIMMILLSLSGKSQDFELDTQEVLDVIKKWNFAVNARSEETLRGLYADRVIYYAEEMSRNKCISLKRTFFATNPSFKQKIVTDPKFVAHTAGVVKATFTREVFQQGKWKKIPTYLLISYEKKGYRIAGESDPGADAAANYKLEIGEAMDIPQSTAQNTLPIDSATIPDSTTQIDEPDSVIQEQAAHEEDSAMIAAVTKEVLSDETVAIPKKYVYILIGVLVLITAVVVFSKGSKKSSYKSKKKISPDRETTLIRNEKGFESFVIALFDPHYFTVRSQTPHRVYAGNSGQPDFSPDLEVQFQNKESQAKVAIECIYIPQLASRQILSYSANQINRYHDFEEGSGNEVYIVLGLEGEPNDPKELFLIPITDLREGNMGYQELQPFRKHGMFFYNSLRRRLL